jgi:uncharacterized protein
VYGSKMREVLSFRLDSKAVSSERAKAAITGKTLTAYLEDHVMRDFAGKPNSPPALVDVLRLIRSNRADLEKVGIRHAEIFGSVARGEDRPDSDVDVLVDIDPEIVTDLFAYSRVQRTLQDIIGRPVDITRLGRTRPEMDAELTRDAVHAY